MSDEAFVTFLETGTIAGIAVGATAATVEERLGRPPETARLRRGLSLWAYAERLLQVTLERERLTFDDLRQRFMSALHDPDYRLEDVKAFLQPHRT